MGKRKSPGKASEREKKCDEIFNALVNVIKRLQRDIQFLEDKIKYLHKDIYEMKMDKTVEASRAEFLLGLKERKAFVYKHRYENAVNELADFRDWFDYLAQRCEEPKDGVTSKVESSRSKALQNEVRKLRSELEKCKSDKNKEISALLAEKNFVWHQLKTMEDNLNKEITRKGEEVQYANEKLREIVNTADELQLSHEKLKTELSRLVSESVRKSEEISRLTKEIELVKSRCEPPSTVLRSCWGSMGEGKSGIERVIKVKKEAEYSRSSEKIAQMKQTARKSTGGKAPRKPIITKVSSNSSSSRSKRKSVDIITIQDSPKLFNSNFKVPHLKPLASPDIV